MMSQKIVKIIVCGGADSGKTSLIQRHQHNHFEPAYRPSQQVDMSLLTQGPFQMHLWDIPGSESASGRTPVFYEGAAAFLVVADVTKHLDSAADWITDIQKRSSAPVVLLLNKCDLKRGNASKTLASIRDWAQDRHIAAWFEVSALENQGFRQAMQHVEELIAEHAMGKSAE